MARIRTIKPEFFTSEDIVALSPHARLLYIAAWCEADRDGRLPWKPMTLKIRYFPVDDVDIRALCAELVDAGLVRLYGDGLAYIPKFGDHQHINPRETASTLPDPHASARVSDASSTRSDATVTYREEGKGREGKDRDASRDASRSRGSRLAQDWQPSEDETRWARDARPDLDPVVEAERFRDYWIARPGQGGVKVDWTATWRNWIRNANAPRGGSVVAMDRRPGGGRAAL